jgi:hypothetical protein
MKRLIQVATIFALSQPTLADPAIHYAPTADPLGENLYYLHTVLSLLIHENRIKNMRGKGKGIGAMGNHRLLRHHLLRLCRRCPLPSTAPARTANDSPVAP